MIVCVVAIASASSSSSYVATLILTYLFSPWLAGKFTICRIPLTLILKSMQIDCRFRSTRWLITRYRSFGNFTVLEIFIELNLFNIAESCMTWPRQLFSCHRILDIWIPALGLLEERLNFWALLFLVLHRAFSWRSWSDYAKSWARRN